MLAHYKRTPTQKVTRGFSYLFMALCVCVALLPIIWVILSSFKTNSEIFSNGLSLPSHFGFDGYVQALEIAPILKFFANSLIVATITTILNVFCLAMAGYVFAKKRFRFKNTIFAILSLSMVIPTTALMSPVYNIITKLGLYDTKIALILVYTALNMPISLMVLRSAFASIPTELEEAAYIDGAGKWSAFKHVTLPMIRSSFTVCVFLSIVRCFMVFDVNLALTGGGPFNSTELIALKVYNTAFTSMKFGVAQAEAVVLFLIVTVISVLQTYFSMKKEVKA